MPPLCELGPDYYRVTTTKKAEQQLETSTPVRMFSVLLFGLAKMLVCTALFALAQMLGEALATSHAVRRTPYVVARDSGKPHGPMAGRGAGEWKV